MDAAAEAEEADFMEDGAAMDADGDGTPSGTTKECIECHDEKVGIETQSPNI